MSNFGGLNQQMPNIQGMSASNYDGPQKMQAMTKEQIDQSLWAAAQGLALNKLKMFHTMAKQVNDQQ
jgi:hypothetical protein